MCRIPCSLSLHIPTILRRIIMMFPWKTCGTPVPSFFSPVPCVRKMEESLRTLPTKPAQMMSWWSVQLCFLQYLWSAWFARQRAYGGRWSNQTVWTVPHSLSLRGSCSQHGGQGPPYPHFLAGNSTPTIPRMFSKRNDSGFSYGCADAAAADGRRGSHVYEVNLWLWSFARGKPRLGGLSVEKTFERQVAANEASKERAAENSRRRKADKAWFKVKGGV